MIIQLALLFYFLKSYRDNFLHGYITYGQSVSAGTVIFVYYAVIMGIYVYILYAFIDTGLIEKQLAFTEGEMLKKELPQAAIDAGVMSIMVSFSSWGGSRMSAQHYLITDVLKGELEFAPVAHDRNEQIKNALRSHPLLQQKRMIVDSARSTVNYTKWQVFPDFELTGFSEKSLHGKGAGIGISLNIPLWNFRVRETEEAHYHLLQETRELSAWELDVSTRIKTAGNRLRISEAVLNIFFHGLLEQAEKSLSISELSYKQGEISLMDFLDTQRTYFSILEDFQDALYTWNTDNAALEKALGEPRP